MTKRMEGERRKRLNDEERKRKREEWQKNNCRRGGGRTREGTDYTMDADTEE